MWMEAHPDATLSDLAEVLDTRGPRVTAWSTGSEKRQPPYEVLVRLANALEMAIVLVPEGIRVVDNRGLTKGQLYQRRPGENW